MRAVHPGEMVKAELKAREWSQGDLAAILGRSEPQINRLIAGKMGVSVRTARELAQAFGTTPMLWLTAWDDYRLARVKARPVKPSVNGVTVGERGQEKYGTDRQRIIILAFLDWVDTK